MSSVDERDDLTARAGIRNAALRLFAEHGHDAVSVRKIASEADVSPALVLHHFGSKAGLREAVDTYAATRVDALMEAASGDVPEAPDITQVWVEGDGRSIAEAFARVFPPGSPLPAYIRRLILSGDPAGTDLFRRWFHASRHVLDEMTQAGLATPSKDPDVRAAFALASDLALMLLRDPLTDVLGFDPMSPEGLARWSQEVAPIYLEGMFIPPSDGDDEKEDEA